MIAVVDYGRGNLGSVEKAFERLGLEAIVTQDAGVVDAAEATVLPGDGAFHDAMANLDRLGLLPLKHGARDLGRVGQMTEPSVVDRDAGLRDALLQLVPQCERDLVHAAAQRKHVLFGRVVRVRARQVPQSRLALHAHIVLVVLDVEDRLRTVIHAPHHHRRDLNRIAALIVHLDRLHVEVAGTQRQLDLAEERVRPAPRRMRGRPRLHSCEAGGRSPALPHRG